MFQQINANDNKYNVERYKVYATVKLLVKDSLGRVSVDFTLLQFFLQGFQVMSIKPSIYTCHPLSGFPAALMIT